MSNRSNYLLEAFILGILIFWGLTEVNISVTVNVTDKPIVNQVKNAETLQNVERIVR